MPKPNNFICYTIRCNVPVGNNVASVKDICGSSLDISLVLDGQDKI